MHVREFAIRHHFPYLGTKASHFHKEGHKMAQKTVTHLFDDIDGSEATETVSFAVHGTSYEIDLNENNAAELRDALAPYVAAARRASGGSVGGDRSRGSRASKPRSEGEVEVDSKAVRTWAEANGVEVSARGRISAEVLEKYKQAN